jgi:uncharacterized protein
MARPRRSRFAAEAGDSGLARRRGELRRGPAVAASRRRRGSWGLGLMTLMERISADMTTAMRGRDQVRLMPLRMAKAALMNREIEKGRALDEAEAQQVVASLIKQRRDSVEQFTAGGRPELAARETAEIAVLEAYVPPPLDPAEVERAVDEAVRETGATAAKDMGRVMKAVMPRLAGRGADGRVVNDIVRRKLGGA